MLTIFATSAKVKRTLLSTFFWSCAVISRFQHNFKWLLRTETSLHSLEPTPSLDIGFTPHPSLSKNQYFFMFSRKALYRDPQNTKYSSSNRPFPLTLLLLLFFSFLSFAVFFFFLLFFLRSHGWGTVAGVDTCGIIYNQLESCNCFIT